MERERVYVGKFKIQARPRRGMAATVAGRLSDREGSELITGLLEVNRTTMTDMQSLLLS